MAAVVVPPATSLPAAPRAAVAEAVPAPAPQRDPIVTESLAAADELTAAGFVAPDWLVADAGAEGCDETAVDEPIDVRVPEGLKRYAEQQAAVSRA